MDVQLLIMLIRTVGRLVVACVQAVSGCKAIYREKGPGTRVRLGHNVCEGPA